MRADSGGDSICGMMPTNGLEVKRQLLHLLAFLPGVDEQASGEQLEDQVFILLIYQIDTLRLSNRNWRIAAAV